MTTPRYDIIGQALADTSRARMLCELMEGRVFTNKELASAAGISPQTATSHLRLLQDAGLIVATKSGRCVYHRLANADVAEMLERLASLTPQQHLYVTQRRKAKDLALARSCYDHLAGPLAVALTDHLLKQGALSEMNGVYLAKSAAIWTQLGVTLPDRPTRQAFARPCLDWTERKPHIAGPLGRQILSHAFDRKWILRNKTKRGIRLTADGNLQFGKILGLDPARLMELSDHG